MHEKLIQKHHEKQIEKENVVQKISAKLFNYEWLAVAAAASAMANPQDVKDYLEEKYMQCLLMYRCCDC